MLQRALECGCKKLAHLSMDWIVIQALSLNVKSVPTPSAREKTRREVASRKTRTKRKPLPLSRKKPSDKSGYWDVDEVSESGEESSGDEFGEGKESARKGSARKGSVASEEPGSPATHRESRDGTLNDTPKSAVPSEFEVSLETHNFCHRRALFTSVVCMDVNVFH